MNLYELKENWKKIESMLYEEDIDEKMIKDTLESIEGEIEDKADNYAKIIKMFENNIVARKLEAKRLSDSAEKLENRVKLLKQNLFNAMKTVNKPKFSTKLFNFSIVKNGGKQALTINGEVPEEYTKTKIENDTEKIRKALEAGTELTFAHLEPRGESLRIK